MMKNVLKILCASLLTICLLIMIAWVFHSKAPYHKMNEFYKYSDDYEVWFLGSSYVVMGTLPEELYDEYGIRSYNLAEYGQTIAIDYWVMRNMLKISKPKLVVLDVGQIWSWDKYSEDNISCVRRMVSSFPMGKEKLAAIDDLFDDDVWKEMIFPFCSDHYNWEYLSEDNFKLEKSYTLGSDQNYFDEEDRDGIDLVTPYAIPEAVDISRVGSAEELSVNYLRDFIELCQSNDIEVLLVKTPLAATEGELLQYNHAFSIGQEYGVPYINGFELEGIFDGDTDLVERTHLNSLGARKWTHVLGDYICKHYPQISTDTSDTAMKKRWGERYHNYLSYLDTKIPIQDDFYSYLMLCSNPRYSLEISIKSDCPVAGDALAMKLMGKCNQVTTFFTDDGEKADILIGVKNSDGIIIDNASFVYDYQDNTTYERLP